MPAVTNRFIPQSLLRLGSRLAKSVPPASFLGGVEVRWQRASIMPCATPQCFSVSFTPSPCESTMQQPILLHPQLGESYPALCMLAWLVNHRRHHLLYTAVSKKSAPSPPRLVLGSTKHCTKNLRKKDSTVHLPQGGPYVWRALTWKKLLYAYLDPLVYNTEDPWP